MAQQVLLNIINSIKEAGIFSILVDETQDLSRHEQVSFIIRFVDDSFQIHEQFLGFYKTSHTDSETLANLIKKVLSDSGLDIQNLRGQCYDGAAAMRGSYTGVQARIREENPIALYVHCYAHILNLCLVDLSKQVSYVRNTFGTLQSLYSFVGASSKRNAVFESVYLASTQHNGPKKLKSLSETRWSCRAEALKAVLLNFSTLINTLEEISENNINSGAEATSLIGNIQNFEFVFCLIILQEIMEHTNVLSKYLQSINISYITVIEMCEQTVDILKDMRTDTEFHKRWIQVIKVTGENNIEPPKLSRKRRIPQKYGGGENGPQNVPENQLQILNGLKNLIINDNFEENMLTLVCNTYKLDMQPLKNELNIFNRMFASKYPNISGESNIFKKKSEYIANHDIRSGFPLTYTIFKTFLTIPTNTASCERSFSCLRRLKTYLRTTMGQERLSSLSLLQIEKNQQIDEEKVIDEFNSSVSVSGRRLALA
ncbi:zinc finger MYM-type protein 1-like [Acyrthosiphon pisum]|uniref:Zinc finger MYM-type protein 1-like n=1 Tax=Acyrthosiphon pisum TaxID=7029 RepID=A0A8R2B4U1_ACYPI|nr:zinc finger MYM-type protein 1-like [Acyrthosiphon pisum]|eukprot:XP_008181768.1 PREDICTED: zinc finger MYM-type protein 1-like [Acyrthosiphon pisum]